MVKVPEYLQQFAKEKSFGGLVVGAGSAGFKVRIMQAAKEFSYL